MPEYKVPKEVIEEERRKRAVRFLGVEEVEAMRQRWKYDYKSPDNLELECLFRTVEFALEELEHIIRQDMGEE